MPATSIELSSSDFRELSGDEVAFVSGGGGLKQAVLGAAAGAAASAAGNRGGVGGAVVGAIGGFFTGLFS